MTSSLKFLALVAAVFVTCATARNDPAPPVASHAPAAGYRPALQGEPQLTAEEEQALRIQLAECQRFAGLSHHAAEVKATEERRATHGTDPRFEGCLATFRELADGEATLAENDPRGRDCVHEITRGSAGKDVREMLECVERTVDDVDRSARKIAALVRNEELLPAHDECFTWLGLDEKFFFLKELSCREVNDVLRRQGNEK